MKKVMSAFGQLSKIFVYGTLKRGQPNHIHMNNVSLGHCRFVAQALTTNKYPLLIATKWNLPFLLDRPGVGKRIQGEVYEVDDQFLEWLNEFENLYLRKEITVEIIGSPSRSESGINEIDHLSSTKLVHCSAYFLTNYPPSLLDLTLYANYDCYADHKRIYNRTDDDSTPETLMAALVKEVERENIRSADSNQL